MSQKDWEEVQAAAAVGGAVVALHGITSQKWEWWHTVFSVIGAIALVALLS